MMAGFAPNVVQKGKWQRSNGLSAEAAEILAQVAKSLGNFVVWVLKGVSI
jgi:hypothetical protein